MTFITDLGNLRFIRFNNVFLIYEPGSQSIDEKLQLLQNRLQLFKSAFGDLKEITLAAKINQNDQSQFRDHFQLLEHIRKKVLSICDTSPFYSLHIDFQSDNDAAGNVISQILQLPSINRCQEVQFHYADETFIQLPVEVIANWLNRNSGVEIASNGTGQSKKGLDLTMNHRIKIQNAVEMCDNLKIVRAFFNFFGRK